MAVFVDHAHFVSEIDLHASLPVGEAAHVKIWSALGAYLTVK